MGQLKSAHCIKQSASSSVYDHYKPKVENSNAVGVVFLHGLPGAVTKNNDCAEAYSSEFGINTFVYHYKGLGVSKGVFSLKDSANEVREFIFYLSQKYNFKEIVLVSHSYSSMTCLRVLRDSDCVVKAVLLAPVINIFSKDQVKNILVEANKILMGVGKVDIDTCMQQYQDFVTTNNPERIIKSLSNVKQVIAIVPSKDKVIDPEFTLSKKDIFDKTIILEDDHWFSNRKTIMKTLNEVI